MNTERDAFPLFQAPGDKEPMSESDEEFELSEVYKDSLPEKVKKQFIESWGDENHGWKIKAIAGTALTLVVTVAGQRYFQRDHGRESEKD